MKIFILFSLFLATSAWINAADKPGVWIFSDMSDSRLPGDNHRGTINDPDDISAMAGYLLMANEFDTRGIVIASTNRPDHHTTPDQADWASDYFGKAYQADLPGLNKHLGGYPESITFMQSSIMKTAEKFSPENTYLSLETYSTVAALLKEVEASKKQLNVLCWGSLTESAIFVKHCIDANRTDDLKKVRFIAHWTESTFHMGTPENPRTVPNCAEDAAACRFLKDASRAGLIQYFECGAIGQHGIVGGAPSGEKYYHQFKSSQLGRIFTEGKFVRGKVDHSDSATYWVLLGKWGVTLNEISSNGSNEPAVEKTNEQNFRDASPKIHAELLRRSESAARH